MILMAFLLEHESLNQARRGPLSAWAVWENDFQLRKRLLDSFGIIQGAGGRNRAWAY